jgi:hypothetical protein
VIAELDGLRDEWAAFVKADDRLAIPAHAYMKDALDYLESDLVPALSRLGRYAVSGWAGLQITAPFLTSVSVIHVYVDVAIFHSKLRQTMQALRIREVKEGARIIFWAGRPAFFVNPLRAKSSRTTVVHPSRLYADLLTMGGRGEEAAEHARLVLIASPKGNVRAKRGD